MSRENDYHRRRNNNRDREAKPSFPIPAIPKVDYPPDPVSGNPIENVFQAFNHRIGDQPINFETAYSQVLEQAHLSLNEALHYIGNSQFAVYREIEENGRKILELQRKITYDEGDKPQWRKDLSPGISRDYKPEPTPLVNLYTDEELANFPKVGAGSGIYLPRNS